LIYALAVPAAVPDVEEIRVLEWSLAPGETAAAGDLIVELETHKAVIEVRAAQPGVLRSVLAEAGDWRGVGVPLAVFSDHPEEVLPEDAGGLERIAVAFEVT
jgi:pyruvate/2-oxoglutarate dehydrogenase complex dihydrolipoamide acyltransferase (E2) component